MERLPGLDRKNPAGWVAPWKANSLASISLGIDDASRPLVLLGLSTKCIQLCSGMLHERIHWEDILMPSSRVVYDNGRLNLGVNRTSLSGSTSSIGAGHQSQFDGNALQKDRRSSQATFAIGKLSPIPAPRLHLSAGGSSNCARGRAFIAKINDYLRRSSQVAPIGPIDFPANPQENSGNGRGESSEIDDKDESQKGAGGDEHQKSVLILMSDTGGGHRASAEALKDTFELEYGKAYKVHVIDLWKEHTPWPFSELPRSYSFLVKHETLWRFTFHATKPRFVHQSQMAATSAFVAREVAKGLQRYKPDVIVSVHPLMQHIPLRVLRSKGLLHKIPFTTVITDLTTCHPTWFHKLVTVCFCPTKEVAQRALKAGLQLPQIRVHGLPIRPSFCQPTAPKEELRKNLGMDAELPAVLLMGGGEGMGPVEATALALAESLGRPPPPSADGEGQKETAEASHGQPLGQLIIVCGRNKKLQARLEGIKWPMPTQVKGFVRNMPEWMEACDIIITKAGPGTIAESMIRGLPMIINDFIAGQEAGNVPYVVENGAGKFCDKPKVIAKMVAEWFGPMASELKEMAGNALRLARPEAVFDIVRDLDALARNRRDELSDVERRGLALL
eukprot:TRINITY_DN4144_c0_g1_i1.p1 TRINITY_DN4144_c0_g1~~TRINITY_DN4144_c0_g1_i1.p1  ORF type:complete len:617 (+),score=138.84 TRINITY_DN4144_c0_g1_i1:117-1967(+)